MSFINTFKPVFLQLAQIALVILLFKTIPDRQWAGLLASAVFISVAAYLMSYFYQQLNYKSAALYALLIHLFFFIVPILGIRLAFWGTPFEEIGLGSLKLASLHSFSEKFYLLVLLASLYDCFQIKKLNSDSLLSSSN